MTDEQFEALAEEVAAAIVNADLEHVGHFCPWPGPASEAYDSVREDYRQAARVAIRVILKKLPAQQPTTECPNCSLRVVTSNVPDEPTPKRLSPLDALRASRVRK